MSNEPVASEGHPFTIEVDAPNQWERVLHVTVPREVFDREYTRRLSRAVKGFERPGFRKGRTPRGLVEKELGDRLRAETFETIVPQAFKAAIIEHELLPITDPDLRNLHFEENEPIAFDMHVEVRPRITAHDYEDLDLKRREVAVAGEEVDAMLDHLRDSRAIWEKVDRPAIEGDQLTLDVTPLSLGGEADEAKTIVDQKIVLGAEQNLPAFNEGLAGAAAGEEREIEVTYPDDYVNESLRGRTVRFGCKVKEVGVKVLPEVDDAFAAQLAEGRTLLELRGEIRHQLEHEAEARSSRELDEQMVDRLVDRHEIEVPPSLVEQYLASSLEELHARNLQTGRQSTAEEDQQFRELTRPVAERVLKGMFVMEAVRRQESLTVADEEIDARIAEIAGEHGFDVEKYREYAAQGNEREKIRHGLEERKTLDFLLSRAKIEMVPADGEIGTGADAPGRAEAADPEPTEAGDSPAAEPDPARDEAKE